MRTNAAGRRMIRAAAAFVAIWGVVGAGMSAGGCYRRVVSARGFGADQYQVSEPYQENSKIDDWVFGERVSNNRSRLKSADAK